MKLGTFDIIALIVILIPAIKSLIKGFLKEIFETVGLVGGLILGRLLCVPVGSLFKAWISNEWAMKAVGFVVVYLIVFLACFIIQFVAKKAVNKVNLTTADRIGGFLVGAIKGMLLIGVFVLLVNGLTGSIDKSFLKDTYLARPLLGFMKIVTGIVIPTIKSKVMILINFV